MLFTHSHNHAPKRLVRFFTHFVRSNVQIASHSFTVQHMINHSLGSPDKIINFTKTLSSMEKPIQSVELADLVFKAMNQSDLTDVEPFIHEDIIFDFPGIGRVEGSKRVLIFLKALLRKYRILTFTWEKNYRIILRVPC